MLKINKQTITLTKGDDASLRLVPRYKDRTEYVLTEGDRTVFRIKFGHTLVELDCTLNLETNKIVANITPNDTKDFNPGIYRYEAELITSFGFHYTFIADQTFILGQEYEQRITSTSNGNGTTNGNLPEIDGIVDGEPVVYGDIQPTNPMMDYEELNHLPKLNNKTIKGDHDSEYYGIATKTSELENDSDFVSDDEYVHTDNNYDDTAKDKVDALGTASTYDVPESGNASTSQVVKGDDSRLRDNRDPNPHTHQKADITDFPTNVSAFNNDSGFITNTVNNLANYYLKADTYTKTEVEQLIAAIKQGKFEIVAELPASGDANVIYLVPKSTAQTSNSYDEYVYINNAWELIGDTEIDLSGYVTDDELTTALQSYLTTSAFNTAIANYYTKTETDNLLGNKVDKVAGKGLSTNDYDNTAKSIVDGVTSALNDKVDKVQGKGLSTNDYDNTAKGIVDGVTSALADKVDKVNGKGLSTEDYTTADKTKLSGISDNATKTASSTTNGHIEIDDVDTTVYDDTAVTTAIENIEDELSTDSATIEGNPINFSTLSAQKSKSTILSLEPIQDLHGYDYPWIGGAGKNLLPLDVATIKSLNTGGTWSGNVYTLNTAIFTIVTDSDNNVIAIKVKGSAPSGTHLTLNIYSDLLVSSATIISSGHGGENTPYVLEAYRNDGTKDYFYSDKSGYIPNVPANVNLNRIRFVLLASQTVSSEATIYPMLRLSTVTDATFAPYTNLCPITGRTQVGIEGCGKNLFDKDATPYYSGKYIDISTPEWDGSEIPFVKDNANYNTYKIPIKANTKYWIEKIKASAPVMATYDKFGNVTYARHNQGGTEGITYSIDTGNNDAYMLISVAIQGTYKSDDVLQIETNTSPTQYTAYQPSNDVTIAFGQTVYGGQVDVENGALVVDREIYTLGNLTWTYDSTWKRFISQDLYALQYKDTARAQYLQSSDYEVLYHGEAISNTWNGKMYSGPSSNTGLMNLFVHDLRYTNTSDFLTAMGSSQVAYPLKDSYKTTINLTPHIINLLKGVNNISTDGDKITLTYRDGSVATLEDVKLATENLETQIADAQILTDTVTGDKYILVVTNGVLSVEQVSD